ncbi:MAG: hypothetical protein AAF497_03210 [Planctomycetota bacterium]
MGNTIWVKVESAGDISCDERDHSIMCSLYSKLDRIARETGVTPPSDFFDAAEMAAEFAEGDIPLPTPQWYDPTIGLATIDALLVHLDENPELFTYPDDASRSHWRSYLLEELNNCKSVLSSAAASGARFHFAILM